MKKLIAKIFGIETQIVRRVVYTVRDMIDWLVNAMKKQEGR